MADWANEREAAVDILIGITKDGGYNNIVLRRELSRGTSLDPRRRASVTGLVNGVLRNMIYIDYVINLFSNTKTGKMRPFILNTLRCGVYEACFTDAKGFAVCNEAVAAVKRRGLGTLSGFVNGVLRNIIRAADADAVAAPGMSVRYSYPKWMADGLVGYLGAEETEEMFKVNGTPPDVTVCVNTLKTDREGLKEILEKENICVSYGRMDENALHLSKTADIAGLGSFRDGLFHVMDESAMAAVKTLDSAPGMTVLDLCAAPGGKSYCAAYLAGNRGRIISNDIYPHKIKLVRDGADRLGIGIIETSLYDAAEVNKAWVGISDRVLVDAPCSGFGIIRKKPDIKFTKTQGDVEGCAELQKRILAAAQGYVKPGGRLVYCTCTLTRKENEDNAEWFSNNYPFTLIGMRRILPQDCGTDGFFVAAFGKG